MPIYAERYAAGFGSFPFGAMIYSQSPIMYDYNLRLDGQTDDNILSFGFGNGSFLESFPLDVQNTIFEKLSFVLNEGGNCQSFKFSLNRLPDVPLITYSEFILKFGTVSRMKGYITKRSLPGEDDKLEFSGYGFFKRIEKSKIKNTDRHIIQSISQSGSSMTLNFSGTPFVAGSKVGLKAVVSENVEDKNNGVFDITANTTNSITVTNPSGITNTSISGITYVLPYEWTNSVRVDLLIKKTLSMTLIGDYATFYDVALISETTGILSAGEVNFEGMEIGKFFTLMRKLLQKKYYFGVNGDGKVFLILKSYVMVDKFHAGFHFPQSAISTDEEVAGNIISVYRSDSKTGRRGGSVVAGTASNPTSIAKYGPHEYSEDIPAYLSNDTGQLYADSLLALMAEPIISGDAKNLPFKFYPFGIYGYVTKTDFYPFTIEDFDSLTGFVTDAEIAATLSGSRLVNGDNCHKLAVTSASLNKIHRKPISFRMNAGLNMFFYMFTTAKIKIRFGFGTSSWNENTFDFETFAENRWFPYKIAIPDDKRSIQINHIGFQILSDVSADIYLDFLNCFCYTALHYELELDQAEYVIETHERYVNLRFGDLTRNPKFEQYVAGIKAQAEIAKLMIRQ